MKNKILISLMLLLPIFAMAQTEALVKWTVVSSSQITIQSNKAFPNAIVLISRAASDASLSTLTTYNNTIFVNNPVTKIRAANHNQMNAYLINNFAYTDVLTQNDAAYVGVNLGSNTYTHDCNSEQIMVRVIDQGSVDAIRLAYKVKISGSLSLDSTSLGRMTDSILTIDGNGLINFITRDSIVRISGDTTFVGTDTVIAGGLRPEYLSVVTSFDTVIVVDASGDAAKAVVLDIKSIQFDSLSTDTMIVDSNLTATGGIYFGVTTLSGATYTLKTADYTLHSRRSLVGTQAITLPTAQMVRGRTIIVKDADGNASANNITITTQGAETIDGEVSVIINGDYNGVALYSDGSQWFVLYIIP